MAKHSAHQFPTRVWPSSLGIKLLRVLLLQVPHIVFFIMLWISFGYGSASSQDLGTSEVRVYRHPHGQYNARARPYDSCYHTFRDGISITPCAMKERMPQPSQLGDMERFVIFVLALPAAYVLESLIGGAFRHGMIQGLWSYIEYCMNRTYNGAIAGYRRLAEISSTEQQVPAQLQIAPRNGSSCGTDTSSSLDAETIDDLDSMISEEESTHQTYVYTPHRRTIPLPPTWSRYSYTVSKARGYLGSECLGRTTADQLRVVGITVPQPKVRDQIYLRLRKDPEALLRRSMPVEEHTSHLPEASTDESPSTGEQDNLTLGQDLAEEGKEPREAEAEINPEAFSSVESKSGLDETRTSNADPIAEVESDLHTGAVFDAGLAKEIDEDTMMILLPEVFEEDIMMNDVMQADVVRDEIVQDEVMQDATATQDEIVQDEVMQDVAAVQHDAMQNNIPQRIIVPNTLMLEEIKG